jgi:hypothetical protein
MTSITSVTVADIRFPTSRTMDGSDAMNKDGDYSAAYVTISTDDPAVSGFGFTFTIGRGNDLCVEAARQRSLPLISRDVATHVERGRVRCRPSVGPVLLERRAVGAGAGRRVRPRVAAGAADPVPGAAVHMGLARRGPVPVPTTRNADSAVIRSRAVRLVDLQHRGRPAAHCSRRTHGPFRPTGIAVVQRSHRRSHPHRTTQPSSALNTPSSRTVVEPPTRSGSSARPCVRGVSYFGAL